MEKEKEREREGMEQSSADIGGGVCAFKTLVLFARARARALPHPLDRRGFSQTETNARRICTVLFVT